MFYYKNTHEIPSDFASLYFKATPHKCIGGALWKFCTIHALQFFEIPQHSCKIVPLFDAKFARKPLLLHDAVLP